MKKFNGSFWRALGTTLLLGVLAACSKEVVTQPNCIPSALATAKAFLTGAAEAARGQAKSISFEEFEAKTYKEPFAGGKYIVNGDTPIRTKDDLQKFFNSKVKGDPQDVPAGFTTELVVHQVNGQDAVWSDSEKMNLTYCVSTDFGTRHTMVVSDMEAATNAWESVAAVNFLHVPGEDNNCNPSNQNVQFDVRPVNVNGQYLARAFFPQEPRDARNVLIDESAFSLNPGENLTLTGILRHELGHTIGFRHEHTRPESGACFEDNNWRPLTDYDAFSVMHYPQCNGLGDWSLTLTQQDKNGAACLYGAASGAPAPVNCGDSGTPPPPAPAPTCASHVPGLSGKSVAEGIRMLAPSLPKGS